MIVRAIEFQLNASKLLDVRFGESEFKVRDEFWYDFRPDSDGVKTTSFCPNLVKDTPNNREVIEALKRLYQEQKAANDAYDKQMYAIRNQFEK